MRHSGHFPGTEIYTANSQSEREHVAIKEDLAINVDSGLFLSLSVVFA